MLKTVWSYFDRLKYQPTDIELELCKVMDKCTRWAEVRDEECFHYYFYYLIGEPFVAKVKNYGPICFQNGFSIDSAYLRNYAKESYRRYKKRIQDAKYTELTGKPYA